MRSLAEISAELDLVQDRLSLAVQCGNMGIWDWNIETGELYWDEGNKRLFRINPFAWKADYQSFADLLDPDDAASVAVTLKHCLASHTPYDYRFRLKDGRVIRGMGKAYYRDGEPVRMVGVCVEEPTQSTI